MANVNYLSPAGMQPKLGWQPSAGLAGMLYHDQNQDYNQVMELQKLMSVMDAQQKVDDRAEYAKSGELRDAERLYKTTKARTDNQTYGPLAQMGVEDKRLDLGAKQSTYAGNVAATNAANASKVDSEILAKTERGLQKLEALSLPLMNAGPLQMQMLDEVDMPEQIKNYLKQASGPDDFAMRLNHILQSGKEAIKHQRALAVEDRKGQWDYKRATDVAHIAGQYGNDRAGIMANKPGTQRPMTSDQRFALWVEEQVASGQMTMQEGMEMIARLKAASKQQDPSILPGGGIGPRGDSGNILPTPGQNNKDPLGIRK